MVNFINPYNFIPMGKKKKIAESAEGTYTGVIEYSVLTKSPLFIPNTSNEKTFQQSYEFDARKKKDEHGHKSYDFYSYNDLSLSQDMENHHFRPVIPGSEIRGMFRSNFEILTDSCMSALDTDEQLSKRTMERFSAGLLGRNPDGSFALYEAQDVLWRTKGENNPQDELNWQARYYTRKCYIQDRFPEGCHVSYTEIKRDGYAKPLASNVSPYKSNDRRTDGYLIKGEAGPESEPNPGSGISSQKHCSHIFRLKGGRNAVPKKVSIDKLEAVLREYDGYEEYKKQWKDFKESGRGYFPVYYSLIKENTKEICFLSPACITREIYDSALADLAGDLKPCDRLESLCPACRLFGTVIKDGALASRIRFSDLEGEEREDYRDCYEQPTTLPPLSSPKLNNMEFYLKRPNGAWFWTYDYYIDKNGTVRLQPGELAGRKFYWHSVKSLDALKRDWGYSGEADQLNVTVRPLKEGYTFKGKLYFKKLTQRELDLLIYLINAGDDGGIREKRHGYKLGAAKPLGFGSIACHIDRIELISYRCESGVAVKERYEPAIKECPVSMETAENFKKMTNFETASRNGKISYPRTARQNSDEGFAWFVENHGGYDRRRQKPEKMPSKRENMLFKEYMEAMEPVLKSTGTPAGSGNVPPYQKGAGKR